ncbi:hypothetical protein PN36_15965 [Candidatus Thiomargarita nelsonii]|uniref:LamG-like jellyroll fold domain-containing protein n=1 Tax=Candidatus Thiomargarita nelsonii TaxID=1003181 RepID=A0A0A6P1P0_9GAMM|nr:hypothetical protein PN36_15965 [Candidatus Thiomargarita nelsonii]
MKFTTSVLTIIICATLMSCSRVSTTIKEWKNASTTPLVGHWRFDDSKDVIALDSSALKNNGTLVGMPSWETEGKLNGALFFDGKKDYVTLGKDSFNLTSKLSVSLWVKVEKTNSDYQTLIQRGRYVYPFMVQLEGSNRIRTAVRTMQRGESSDTHYLFSVTHLVENRWYHVAITYQNGEYILYIDGKQESKDVVNGELAVERNHTTTIGGQPAVGLSYLQGWLDDVRIYKIFLTPSQVQAIFKKR